MASAANITECLKASLFGVLPDDKIVQLRSLTVEHQMVAGEFIIHEGTQLEHMFLILEGEVEILKTSEDSGEQYRLRMLPSGETLGEMSLIELNKASASARLHQPGRLLFIPLSPLRQLMQNDTAFHRLYESLATILNQRLHDINLVTVQSLEKELEHEKARVGLATLLITLLLMLCGYTYLLKFLSITQESAWISSITTPMLILTLTAAWVNIRIFKFPLSFYGLTIRNWKRSVLESCLLTVPWLGLTLWARWLLISYTDAYSEMPLFHFTNLWQDEGGPSMGFHVFDILLYLGFGIPTQEFIARGGIQSCLQRFLVGRYRSILAILTSSLLFSVFHIFISMNFALVTLCLGVFWGWLYHRHGTLIGAIISHILLGLWGTYALGMFDIL